MSEYHFGFADIEHSKINELIEMMDDYNIVKYIIAREKVEGKKTHVATNGEHYHFVIYTDLKTYKNFKETLKNKYNLSGKNGKTGRFAGWIEPKKVKSEHKFMSYTVKDNNITWKGFEPDEIKQLLDESYQKQDTLIEELMKMLKQQRPELRTQPAPMYNNQPLGPVYSIKYDITNLELAILKFHMDKEKRVCKSQIKNLALTYLQLHMIDRYQVMDTIYHYTMNN